MSEEWDDIPQEAEDAPIEEPLEGADDGKEGKFSRLLGSDSRKFKLSGMFKDWFLDY